jgi:hypothetical protein
MQFYLGTHKPAWLEDDRFANVPLFVSRRTLAARKVLPRARGSWALDSGGFTELQMFGRWTLDAKTYAGEVRRFRDEIGNLAWAAPQDWMCEPIVLRGGRAGGVTFAGTGLSVDEHQRRTVENFLDLRSIAPDLPFIPVLQGWAVADYWRCVELYDQAGVDLRKEKLVGVGTVCRRQGTSVATLIMRTLAAEGLRLHGFGFKTQGIQACQQDLASADSLAWSAHARRRAPLPGHDEPGPARPKGHINCANCPDYAIEWRSDLLESIARRDAGPLFRVAA